MLYSLSHFFLLLFCMIVARGGSHCCVFFVYLKKSYFVGENVLVFWMFSTLDSQHLFLSLLFLMVFLSLSSCGRLLLFFSFLIFICICMYNLTFGPLLYCLKDASSLVYVCMFRIVLNRHKYKHKTSLNLHFGMLYELYPFLSCMDNRKKSNECRFRQLIFHQYILFLF